MAAPKGNKGKEVIPQVHKILLYPSKLYYFSLHKVRCVNSNIPRHASSPPSSNLWKRSSFFFTKKVITWIAFYAISHSVDSSPNRKGRL